MDRNTAITIESYNTTVDSYCDKTASLDVLGIFEKHFTIPPHAKVLDAGCAFGRDVRLLHGRGFAVVGVDFAEKMIEEAKKRVPGADFFVADVRDLPFEADTFDVILCNAVLMHLEKRTVGKALQEFHRVLKPGGTLLLCNKEGTGEGIEFNPSLKLTRYTSYFTLSEMSGYLKTSGFAIRRSWIQEDLRRNGVQWTHFIAEKK